MGPCGPAWAWGPHWGGLGAPSGSGLWGPWGACLDLGPPLGGGAWGPRLGVAYGAHGGPGWPKGPGRAAHGACVA
jgi:hypothetical protein